MSNAMNYGSAKGLLAGIEVERRRAEPLISFVTFLSNVNKVMGPTALNLQAKEALEAYRSANDSRASGAGEGNDGR